MTRHLISILIILLASALVAEAQDRAFFLTNTEEGIVGFVDAHDDVDYTRYRVGGCYTGSTLTLVEFAAARNYTGVLHAVQRYGAISNFVINPLYHTPLEAAVFASATQSVEFLSSVRPDWINAESVDGWPLILKAAVLGDRRIVELLLDAGANVNATNSMGLTLADIAARVSLDVFGLVRSRGGCFQGPPHRPSLGAVVRAAVISNYAGAACEVYSNRFVLPSSESIVFPRDLDPYLGWQCAALTPEDQTRLRDGVMNVASNCDGTVVVRYYDDAVRASQYYLFPLLRSNRLYGLFLPADGVTNRLFHEEVFPVLGE